MGYDLERKTNPYQKSRTLSGSRVNGLGDTVPSSPHCLQKLLLISKCPSFESRPKTSKTRRDGPSLSSKLTARGLVSDVLLLYPRVDASNLVRLTFSDHKEDPSLQRRIEYLTSGKRPGPSFTHLENTFQYIPTTKERDGSHFKINISLLDGESLCT